MEVVQPEKTVQKIKIQQHTLTGGAWCAAWLFTIGYLHLGFWKALFAIAIWPYFIGHYCASLSH